VTGEEVAGWQQGEALSSGHSRIRFEGVGGQLGRDLFYVAEHEQMVGVGVEAPANQCRVVCVPEQKQFEDEAVVVFEGAGATMIVRLYLSQALTHRCRQEQFEPLTSLHNNDIIHKTKTHSYLRLSWPGHCSSKEKNFHQLTGHLSHENINTRILNIGQGI